MFKTVYLQTAGVSSSDPLTLGDPVGYTVASVFMLFSQYSHELIILRFNSLLFTPSEVVQLEQSCYSSWGDASEFRPHQFSLVDDARRPPSSLWSRLFMLRVHRARQVTWLLTCVTGTATKPSRPGRPNSKRRLRQAGTIRTCGLRTPYTYSGRCPTGGKFQPHSQSRTVANRAPANDRSIDSDIYSGALISWGSGDPEHHKKFALGPQWTGQHKNLFNN